MRPGFEGGEINPWNSSIAPRHGRNPSDSITAWRAVELEESHMGSCVIFRPAPVDLNHTLTQLPEVMDQPVVELVELRALSSCELSGFP